MRLSLRNVGRFCASALIASALVSCGGASSNDQGTTFTLLGFFEEAPAGDSTDLPTGLVGISFPLADNSTETSSTTGGQVVVALGVQNNLLCQGFRTDRVFIDYFVTGAIEQPPSTTQALSLIMGPAAAGGSDTTTGGGSSTVNSCTSSLPPSFSSLPNRNFAEFAIVPASIREWIALNQGSLPEPPFNIEISVVVSGVTTSGDRIDSNAAQLRAQVTPSLTVGPTLGGGADESEA